MPEIHGAKKRFATQQAAENFARHLTRELTAGGIPHWVEVREETPDRWLPIVHRAACLGGADCACLATPK
jgi:hypothetical protein